MSYVPSYTSRINWENEPSTASPINETNLNKMDYALYQHDQSLASQDGRISNIENASKVSSFNGRSGAVMPTDNDYSIGQISATGTAGQVPTLDSHGVLVMDDIPKSGHEIVNPSGTSMTQRKKLKFMGSVSVSDDSANDQTVINVNGGGGGGGGHTIQNPSGSSMTQRTNLQFTGTGVTVTDNSAGDKTVVNIDSSGHTIKDGDGTAMTEQPNLQFVDAKVTNDAQGQATKVQNFVDINWDDWQEVDDNDDTYYRVTDAPLVDGNVEIDLMKKLWENPAPNASFVAQNIDLNSADYDFICIFVSEYTSSLHSNGFMIQKGTTGGVLNYGINDGSKAVTLQRTVTFNSNVSLTISDCGFATGSSISTSNDHCIPIAIYGIKQKVSISLSAIISNVSTSASKCMLSDGETSVEDTLNYSTDEHVVGKWIDGSMLYEKTVDFGTLPNNTYKDVAHNISNLKDIVEIRGVGKISTTYIPLPYTAMTLAEMIVLVIIGASIRIATGNDRSNIYAYVTLRYTKTS